jgi:hypothetical protein
VIEFELDQCWPQLHLLSYCCNGRETVARYRSPNFGRSRVWAAFFFGHGEAGEVGWVSGLSNRYLGGFCAVPAAWEHRKTALFLSLVDVLLTWRLEGLAKGLRRSPINLSWDRATPPGPPTSFLA